MADNIAQVTDADFAEQVKQAQQLVVVDFWAPWCGPCRALAPVLAQLAAEYADKSVKIVKLNTDDNPQSASEHGVQALPTIALFKAGKQVDTVVGLADKEKLSQIIDKHLD